MASRGVRTRQTTWRFRAHDPTRFERAGRSGIGQEDAWGAVLLFPGASPAPNDGVTVHETEIAAAAAARIEPYQTVFIDSSSAAVALAKALAVGVGRRPLTVLAGCRAHPLGRCRSDAYVRARSRSRLGRPTRSFARSDDVEKNLHLLSPVESSRASTDATHWIPRCSGERSSRFLARLMSLSCEMGGGSICCVTLRKKSCYCEIVTRKRLFDSPVTDSTSAA